MKKLVTIAILGGFMAATTGCSDSKPPAKPAETKPGDAKPGENPPGRTPPTQPK